MIVEHGVVDNNRRSLVNRQEIEVRAGVPLNLVVDDGSRALTRRHTDAIDRMGILEIDVRVVGQDIDRSRRILVRRSAVDVGNWRIVGANYCDRHGRRRGFAR